MRTKKEILPGDTLTLRIPKNIDIKVLEWLNTQGSVNNSIITVIEREIGMNGVIDLNPVAVDPLPSAKEMAPYVFEGIQKKSKTEIGMGLQELYNHVANGLKITDTQRSRSSASNESLHDNRIRWIVKKQKSQGLIKVTQQRGFYKLTEIGEFIAKLGISPNDFDAIMEANHLHKKIKKEAEFEELISKLGISVEDVNTIMEANYIHSRIKENLGETQ